MPLVALRYHEITLKRGNRSHFVSLLAKNVRRLLRDLDVGDVRDDDGRLIVHGVSEASWPEVRQRLSRAYGVANYSFCEEMPVSRVLADDGRVDLAPLREGVEASLAGRRFDSFRIDTRRADKAFPWTSPDVNRDIGAHVVAATGARVDLGGAEMTVTIEVLSDRILHSVEKVPGPGGLPVGASGPVVALLSGGIDSPVAALRMMRRGCRVHAVHFHSAPYLDRSSLEKARDLVRAMSRFQPSIRLIAVPFGEVQKEIVTKAPPGPRVVLYRRMMVRIAAAIARYLRAEALVTGESLAQVASQTLRNLVVIDRATDMPILRPLVGMDKEEIVREARQAHTYDISIEPDQDCCSLFVPRHPDTRVREHLVVEAESRLEVDALVEQALAGAAVERWEFPPDVVDPVRSGPLLTPEPLEERA